MRLWRFGEIVIGLTMLAAVPAQADIPFYTLDAELEWEQPAGLKGLILLGLTTPASLVHGQFDAPDPLPYTPLAKAGNATWKVLRWEEQLLPTDRVLDMAHVDCEFGCAKDGFATNAVLTFVAPRSAAQVLVADDAETYTWSPPTTFEVEGVQCSVEGHNDAGAVDFPEDSDRVRGATRSVDGPHDAHLRGECAAQGFRAENPARSWFYGMDVHLEASNGEDEDIQTGTFVERDPTTGLDSKVTQVLELRLHDNAEVALPFEARYTLHASSLQAAGELSLPAATGHLRWDSHEVNGAVQPVTANGRFDLARGAGSVVTVAGETVTGPYGSQNKSLGPAKSALVPVLASAVGLGLLGLLLLRWFLFSRIASDRLLEHPRRARILELVRAQPGLTLSHVGRELGMPWIKVSYHARRLERGGLILVRRTAGRTVLLPPNRGLGAKATQLVLLRRPTHARLIDLVRSHPGIDRLDLARRLRISGARVSQAAQELARAGLLSAERRQRRACYFVREDPLPLDGTES